MKIIGKINFSHVLNFRKSKRIWNVIRLMLLELEKSPYLLLHVENFILLKHIKLENSFIFPMLFTKMFNFLFLILSSTIVSLLLKEIQQSFTYLQLDHQGSWISFLLYKKLLNSCLQQHAPYHISEYKLKMSIYLHPIHPARPTCI